MKVDAINAILVAIAGIIVWINVFKLIRDKIVAGISWGPQAFFTLIGVWNIVYYTALCQPLSFLGNLSVMLGNGTWTCLAIYYTKYPGGKNAN